MAMFKIIQQVGQLVNLPQMAANMIHSVDFARLGSKKMGPELKEVFWRSKIFASVFGFIVCSFVFLTSSQIAVFLALVTVIVGCL